MLAARTLGEKDHAAVDHYFIGANLAEAAHQAVLSRTQKSHSNSLLGSQNLIPLCQPRSRAEQSIWQRQIARSCNGLSVE